MKNVFKKGLILGGLLLVGSYIGRAMSKKDHVFTEEMETELKSLSKNIRKKLGEMDDITKDSFNNIVDAVVNEYAEKKALAEDIKDSFITELQKKWSEMEEEYNTDNKD